MGILSHAMLQTFSLITTSRDAYGDQVESSSAEYACKFREITETDRYGNREDMRGDAMLWVEPSTPLEVGSIVEVENQKFRVERLTKARRMRSESVLFIKCLLEKYHGD